MDSLLKSLYFPYFFVPKIRPSPELGAIFEQGRSEKIGLIGELAAGV
jgi:hypothetical protein